MVNSNHYPVRELSPKALSYFMLIVGLIAIVVSVISQNLLIAASIICFPIILIILIWEARHLVLVIYYMQLIRFTL